MIGNSNFESEAESDSNDNQADEQTANEKTKPDIPTCLDKIEFKDLSEEFKEVGELKDCPFVFLKDSNGNNIVYDAAINDFFEIAQDLMLLASFFIENELIYYEDDLFDDLDVQFYEDKEDGHLTQKNVAFNIAKFDKQFNYEYLMTKLLELECAYQAQKSKLCNLLIKMSDQLSEEKSCMEFFDLISDLMSQRPSLDLRNYKYVNQNLVEMLQRVNAKREHAVNEKTEIMNLATTFIDNYRNEIEHFSELTAIVEDILLKQKKTSDKVAAILKTFEAFHGKTGKKEDFEEYKPNVPVEKVCEIIKLIQEGPKVIKNNFAQPNNVDKVTFSSILFDNHFKSELEQYIQLENKNKLDLACVLNDFMNGTYANFGCFMEQSFRRMYLGELKLLIMRLFSGQNIGDDVSIFEGELYPQPEQCFSLVHSTLQFFKTLPRLTQLQWYDESEGFNVVDKEPLVQLMNRYYSYLFSFTHNMNIRENLLEAGFTATIYKAHSAVIKPVYDLLNKNARFEKPEDMIQTEGNLLSQFMDFGDAYNLSIDEIKMVLNEDLKVCSNSAKQLAKLKSVHDFFVFYCKSLSLCTQLNCFLDKIAECESSSHLTKIFTNKETVFDYLYKVDITKTANLSEHTKRDIRFEFTKGDAGFKSFLLNFDRAFLEIYCNHMMQIKKDVPVDIRRLSKSVSAHISQKYLSQTTGETKVETVDAFDEVDIIQYLQENSATGAEDSTAQNIKGSARRHPRKISKVSIPVKGSIDESVCLTVKVTPFIRELLFYLRRNLNYLGLWLQSSKMIQTMYDKRTFFGYNPSEVFHFQKEMELGFSKLSQTIMKLLKYKVVKSLEDDFDTLFETTPLFDEYGSIKTIFSIPSSRQLREIVKRDMDYLLQKSITDHERKFFPEIEIYSYKRNIVRPARKGHEVHLPEFEYMSDYDKLKNLEILHPKIVDQKEVLHQGNSIKQFKELYYKDVMAHLRKLKNVEINEINRISSMAHIEKPNLSKVLSGLGSIEFGFKKRYLEFGTFLGFSEVKQSDSVPNPNLEVDRVSRTSTYDDYYIDEVQETDLFIFYSQSNKLLSILSLKLITSTLDLEANKSLLLYKNALPFFTMNHLRLSELEELLFPEMGKVIKTIDGEKQLEPSFQVSPFPKVSPGASESQEEKDQSSNHGQSVQEGINSNRELSSKKTKFQYKKLRNYLYVIKRIELKNRSTSRPAFNFVEEVKKKMTSILEDAKLTRPDSVFNTYLNCLFENEQKSIAVALMDTIHQQRWLENFSNFIDINMEAISKDKQMVTITRGILISLLFPKFSSYQVFYDLFTTKPNLSTENSNISKQYPHAKNKSALKSQLTSANLNKHIRRNGLLSLFDTLFINRNEANTPTTSHTAFNGFAVNEFNGKWESLLMQLLSYRSPQRTFISKKIFRVRLCTERDISMPEETILPQNIWLFKVLDSHRLIDMNLKNMILMEAIQTKLINNLFCDTNRERTSAEVEEKHLNEVSIITRRRQTVPSLLPFLSNSMFQKKENYEFSRIVLKLKALELHFTSQMVASDLSIERFPDLKMYDTDQTKGPNVEPSDTEIKIRKYVKLETVWTDHPILNFEQKDTPETSKKKSVHDKTATNTSRGFNEIEDLMNITTASVSTGTYKRDMYNDNKIEILKSIVEGLRKSFFVDDVPQAFNLCYLLLREFSLQASRDEIARLVIERARIPLKTAKCLAKDRLIVSLQATFMREVFTNSYLLDTGANGEMFAIRKNDFNRVLTDWNQTVEEETMRDLRDRELHYLIKIDDSEMVVENSSLNKELVDFYFRHMLQLFTRIVGSRLVLRNNSFMSELDTLARFSTFMNADFDLVFDKIKSKLVSDTKRMIEQGSSANARAKATHEEAVKRLKSELKSAIELERTETLRRMK